MFNVINDFRVKDYVFLFANKHNEIQKSKNPKI